MLLFFLVTSSAEFISNRAFRIWADDSCELYKEWCVETKGFSSKQSYNKNDSCNITVIYEESGYMFPSGYTYEVEIGLADYFSIKDIRFSQFCEELFFEKSYLNINYGTTINWQTNDINEYSGWRFCLWGEIDVYEMQTNWSTTCNCSGANPVSNNYGSYCGVHDSQGLPWCYVDFDQCPDAYWACYGDDNTRWFYCDATASADPIVFHFALGICLLLLFLLIALLFKRQREKKSGRKHAGTLEMTKTNLDKNRYSKILKLGKRQRFHSDTLGGTPYEGSSSSEDSSSGEELSKSSGLKHQSWQQHLEDLKVHKYTDELTFLEKDIAHGAFGTISLAHGPEESMKLAVKEYSKAWGSLNESEKIDFVNEIRHSINLNHINVVRCFGFVVVPKVRVVYEYCLYGSCVDAREEVMWSVNDEEKVEIIIKACSGLIYLGTQGILHRDIAARNILLDQHLTPKITDFGRARKVENIADEFPTEDTVHPLKWTAPEMLLKQMSSEKTDVWAFGIAMLEILTEKEPYEKMSPLDAARAVIREGHRPNLSDIPYETLKDLLSSCWNQIPAGRPTMKEIRTNLKTKIITDVKANAVPTSSFASGTSEAVEHYRQHKEREEQIQMKRRLDSNDECSKVFLPPTNMLKNRRERAVVPYASIYNQFPLENYKQEICKSKQEHTDEKRSIII